MRKHETLGNKYFYLSFAIAFFLLSVFFLFLTSTIRPKTPQPAGVNNNSIAQESGSFVPTKEHAITVLFIGSNAGITSAESYILVRFDPARGSVPIVVFPPQTMLQYGDKTETLSQIFEYGGVEASRTALSQTLGISVDRYVHMNTDVFVACANTIGNVEYDLPWDVPVEQGGMHIVLHQGKQLLDGKKVADIMGYKGYEGGELVRCQLAGNLTAAIVNQRIDIVESTLVDKVFEKIINLIDSDISYLDYDNRKQAAIFLASLRQDPAVSLPVTGIFQNDNAQFYLSDTFLAMLRDTMG